MYTVNVSVVALVTRDISFSEQRLFLVDGIRWDLQEGNSFNFF